MQNTENMENSGENERMLKSGKFKYDVCKICKKLFESLLKSSLTFELVMGTFKLFWEQISGNNILYS